MSRKATTPRKDARWANRPSDPMRRKSRWSWSRRLGVVMSMGLLLLGITAVARYRLSPDERANQPNDRYSAELAASWMARTLNTVAFNNRCMAQMVVQVSVRDSLPQATQDALKDQKALAERLAFWRQQPTMLPWTASAFQAMADEIDSEIAWLSSLENSLGAANPSDRPSTGAAQAIRQAMSLIQQQSLAALDHLALQAEASTLSPPSSRTRWSTGSLDDWRAPIMQGLDSWLSDPPCPPPPPAPPIPTAHRQWSQAIRRDRPASLDNAAGPPRSESSDLDQSTACLPALLVEPSASGPYQGRCPIGWPLSADVFAWPNNTAGFAQSAPCGEEPSESARSQGIAAMIFDRLNNQMSDRLPLSRFSHHLTRQAVAKLRMLWPDADESHSSPANSVSPHWVTSLAEARRRTAQGQSAHETLFAAVEVRSRWPLNDPRLGEAGSWADAQPAYGSIRLIRLTGWVDPTDWPKELLQVADGQWRDLWSYPVHQDQALGLFANRTASGQPLAHTVHRIDDFFFIAADFGQPRPIDNPYAMADGLSWPGPVHWLGPETLTVTRGQATASAFRLLCEKDDRSLWAVHRLTSDAKPCASANVSLSDIPERSPARSRR